MKYLILLLSIFFSCHTFADSETNGDVLHLLLPATAFGMSYVYEDDWEGAIQLIKSGVASRVTVEALKFAVDKDRPDDSGDDSFPSGHTADTFAAASFVQQRYGWTKAIPMYLAASYVAYTRVDSDKHYEIDVIAGAAIGTLSGIYFTDAYEKGIQVSFFSDKAHGNGVSLSAAF